MEEGEEAQVEATATEVEAEAKVMVEALVVEVVEVVEVKAKAVEVGVDPATAAASASPCRQEFHPLRSMAASNRCSVGLREIRTRHSPSCPTRAGRHCARSRARHRHRRDPPCMRSSCSHRGICS